MPTVRDVRLRYSRFVALMKVILPSLAAALLSILVIWPQFSAFDSGFNLGFSDLDLKTTDMLSMQNPRYFGTSKDNLPFSIDAVTATQIDSENMIISLEKPKADVSQKDGSGVLINADIGLFRQKEDILDLMGGVDLYRSDGYEMHTESMRIDVKDGSGLGEDPVEGQGPAGTIRGEGIRISDGGRSIVFTGRAKAVLYAVGNKEDGKQ